MNDSDGQFQLTIVIDIWVEIEEKWHMVNENVKNEAEKSINNSVSLVVNKIQYSTIMTMQCNPWPLH